MAPRLDERFIYAHWTGRGTVNKIAGRGIGALPADSYFAVFPGFPDAHIMAAEGLRAARSLRSHPEPRLRAAAPVLEAQLRRLGLEIKATEARLAAEADRRIKQKIRDSARRPPTSGRMERAIHSRPLQSNVFPALSVGIADLSKLDSPAGRLRYYWRTQEFGSSHIVGLTVPGRFQPGNAAPSQGAFRHHPYFEHVPRYGGTPMRVKRPIEERAFLREAAWEVGNLAATEMQRIRRIAEADAARIATLLAAVKATLGVATPRR
jgi:hypothetical protein